MEQDTPAVLGPVERMVRPYATSAIWRNAEGGTWQQWHDDDDPMPTEWDDRPPDEVVHVYTEAQVADMLAAERERCARIAETPVSGEQDDITMAAKDRIAAWIRKA